eukprot:4694047-Heterocapsa_arctica.AAC.1
MPYQDIYYSYSMHMQTIDGDEFTQDKECVILLDCNKNRRGEQENIYDLMHPIVQKVRQIKKYTRRNDLQQAEHQKQYKNKNTDSHTNFARRRTEQTWRTKRGGGESTEGGQI